MTTSSGLLGVLIGPMTTFAISLLGLWLQYHSQLLIQHRRLRQAHAGIDFIEKWISVYRRINPDERGSEILNRVGDDLARLYKEISESEEGGAFRTHAFARLIREALLLRSIHSRRAQAMRIVYYLALAWTFLGVGSVWSITLEKGVTIENIIVSMLTLILAGFIPAWGIYILTRKFESASAKRRNTRKAPQDP
ncbi:MAG TPA: hypothetical protein VFU43_01740 [Streptosporangiaceae bacterium]|nr:hypothetical protein [Streptosporangiaceae bacterium]